ncbi:MAG: helix-turn-helix domain-containing protein [Candidatus Bathyarchaeota archaeon]|jgi:hypothetical protein
MVGFEEENYSVIFNSLKHPARRKLLKMLAEMPRSLSEMSAALGLSSSHLTYHLEHLGELVFKIEDGKYCLSALGKAAVTTMSKVEEAPRVNEKKASLSLPPLRRESFYVVFLVGLIVLAAISYRQYVSYDRLHAQYDRLHGQHEELKELVELAEVNQASLKFEHILSFRSNRTEPTIYGSPWCFLYNPYEDSTLLLGLTSHLSKSFVRVSLQNESGDVIWSARATMSDIYSVSLISKGWYTISLIGTVTRMNNAVWFGFHEVFDVDCSMSIRILYGEKHSPFLCTQAIYIKN